MLSYDGAEFKAYTKNKWIPFVILDEIVKSTHFTAQRTIVLAMLELMNRKHP